MLTDEKLYNALAHIGTGAYSFDDDDLFEKSKKFLTYLGYEFEVNKYQDGKRKHYITLTNFIISPMREAQIKEIVDRYMEENKDE